MDNPNEYDEDRFQRADIDTVDSISGMWEAGADIGNIEDAVTNGIEGAMDGVRVTVVISLRPR